LSIPLSKVRERTANATGVSIRTVSNIRKEYNKLSTSETEMNSSFSTPNKKRERINPVTGLDDFDQCFIRRLVHEFHINEKRFPTVELIRRAMVEKLDFKGSEKSVRRILRNLGFRWKRIENNRNFLIERIEIREKRISYLQAIRQFRIEKRPIVYMDETFVLSSHVAGKTWSDGSSTLTKPISKGQRLIIIHAGGESGFVDNALTMWKAGQSSGDYHEQMNRENYVRWLEDKLIPNIPPNTVLVIDNAPYHNIQSDKAPTSNSKKVEMQLWLDRKRIAYSEGMLKPQLYKLIKQAKGNHKNFLIDEILQRHGHSVLRLPPYHPDLNPIELIWAEVKNHVARHNISSNFKDVEKLCLEKFSSMGSSDWVPKCQHVKTIEEQYWNQEVIVDDMMDSFIIQTNDSEISDSDEDSDRSSISGLEELE
jgi:transposase